MKVSDTSGADKPLKLAALRSLACLLAADFGGIEFDNLTKNTIPTIVLVIIQSSISYG